MGVDKPYGAIAEQLVSRMNALAIDQDQLFSIRVRALQSMYPQAHKDLLNWAEWSRDIGKVPGTTNGVTSPSLWDQCVTAQFDDWADEQQVAANDVPVKAETTEKLPHDERRGEELDRQINDPNYPAVWRRVLMVAYVWRVPEYQYPDRARQHPDDFLMFLEGALGRMGE